MAAAGKKTKRSSCPAAQSRSFAEFGLAAALAILQVHAGPQDPSGTVEGLHMQHSHLPLQGEALTTLHGMSRIPAHLLLAPGEGEISVFDHMCNLPLHGHSEQHQPAESQAQVRTCGMHDRGKRPAPLGQAAALLTSWERTSRGKGSARTQGGWLCRKTWQRSP